MNAKRLAVAVAAAALLVTTTGGCSKSGPADPPSSPAAADTPATAPAAPPTTTASQTEPATAGESIPGLPTSVADFPRLDGSTAAIPLAQALYVKFAGVSQEEAVGLIDFNTTGPAWVNIAADRADLALVYEAAQDTKQEVAEIGRDLTTTPIGRDALVFVVNEANPINSLKAQQIKDIYAGRITNWSQVGGENEEIVAYQRNEDSGSQTLMRALVMQDTPMAQAPSELVPGSMGDLIDVVANYDNSKQSLGYSVFFYASEMYSQPGVKIIAVDGVDPSVGSIAAGDYAFISPFYAVHRADSPTDSPARALAQWLASPAGQDLVVATGYAPVAP
ncbi:MAG: substrate-binding domain-containing protein [Micrococcales bacterium]|nr:substrate-binding domain-containing protein [Micrococcales bacterium]